MTIHVKPDLEAILKAHVDCGNYPSVEAALEAAVRALGDPEADASAEEDDLSWAKPLLAEAEHDFAEGRTLSHDEMWTSIMNRYGKTKP